MEYSLVSYLTTYQSLAFRKLTERRFFVKTMDIYQECVEDLFRIDHPHIPTSTELFSRSFDAYKAFMLSPAKYRDNTRVLRFPWKEGYYIIPVQELYSILRSSRNRYLISDHDQAKFRAGIIGIAGLSVGSNILNSLVLTSGPLQYSLADGDVLSLTNMNRIFDSLTNIGQSKIVNVMNKNLELDPYMNFQYEANYLTANEFERFFFVKGQKLDIFFEEMDDISLKIKSRFFARKNRIPVVMLTDNGDNVIVDIERFDLEPDRKLLHGLIDEEKYKNIPAKLSQLEKVKLASRIVGPDIVPEMRDSLQLVGSQLPTWPQLGTAAQLSGLVGSYIARLILSNRNIASGRYRVDLDAVLDADYALPEKVLEREEHKQRFVDSMNVIFGTSER